MAGVIETPQPVKRRGRPRKRPIVLPASIQDSPPISKMSSESVIVKKNGLTFNEETYEFDDKFVPMSGVNPQEAHTVPEVIKCLIENKNIDIDARVMCSDGQMRQVSGRENFLEFLKSSEKKWDKLKFAERKEVLKSFKENDFFGTNLGPNGSFGTVNSDDFTPIMGGPFFKQLYPYDYLRMISACYYAYTHDPIAKATIGIMHDFVMGRGFTVVSPDDGTQVVWDAFYKVNDGDQLFSEHFIETEIYGESMLWKLPKNETFISWQRTPEQEPPKGILPRVRLIDPSCIYDIITYPEDIKQVIGYQWVAPTQFQTYTAPGIPSLKFIFTQIPADQVIHVKTNAVSNEKRGRSELFAALGYLKRLRDSVNYSIISQQKNAAWSIDTSVDGDQGDLNNYASSQASLGTLPPAGSEFIHSKKIERKYLGNQSGGGTLSNAFEWCLSMIAAGSRIPVSYYGTHLSGGQTKASAIVATEPVAKMFERKRLRLENTVKEIHYWLTGKECKVIWPELITQDRSAKIRDIALADQQGYFSQKRSAEMIAKEFDSNGDYDFEQEQEQIKKEAKLYPDEINPLTAPGATSGSAFPASNKSGLTAGFKNGVKKSEQ